jgi:hypothetical protein
MTPPSDKKSSSVFRVVFIFLFFKPNTDNKISMEGYVIV